MKQRYDSYKPSGIDWIGEIPSHWETLPLKRNLEEPLMYGANEPAESENIDFPRYIRITDIDSNGNLRNETFKSLEPSKAQEYLLKEGDVLFARSGATVGKTYIFKESYPACFAGYLIKATCSKALLPKFLFYYTLSGHYDNWKNSIFIQSTIQNIGADKYSLLPIPIPPYAEQEAIATWLDEKCSEIDAAIAKVDREIELIDELKQSEISRVVTRGLNPDVPLKQSGIDWIGEVPEHWEILKVKYLVRFSSGDTITSEQFIDTAEYPVYGANGYRGRFDKFNYSGERILIGRVGALCGNVHYTNERIWCSEHALISSKVLGGQEFDYGWLCLLFESMNLNQYGGGSAQPVIASSTIENLSIIFPPLTEQQSIADYLDKKCGEIDGLKEKLVKKRETLKELRQSIISEVVTGKRKVI